MNADYADLNLVLKGQKLIAGGESRHRDEAPGAERRFSRRTLKGSDKQTTGLTLRGSAKNNH